ncbi:hypothetical protein [Methylocystis echinoides]|uniref:hypothetical protein n=1 Tax=Methylocystis echinoides TaxID=29468 RepID=UPI0034468EE7
MTEPKKQPPAPAPSSAPIATGYLVVTDDVGRYRKGQVLPNAPDLVEELHGNFRHATEFDLGVAGIMTR